MESEEKIKFADSQAFAWQSRYLTKQFFNHLLSLGYF